MEIVANLRETRGKKNKNLRNQGWLPAVVYGRSFESRALTLDRKEFQKVYRKAGESTIIDLKIEGRKESLKALIKDVQVDPITDSLIHADFYKADLSEKVTVSIPVEITGESPAVKSGQGIILTLINELEVEALPLDLPHEITIDVSSLTDVGQGIAIKDTAIDPKKVTIKHDPEDLVVKIDYAVQIEKEIEVKGVEEVEVLKEKPEEAGEGEGADESNEIVEKKEERKEKK